MIQPHEHPDLQRQIDDHHQEITALNNGWTELKGDIRVLLERSEQQRESSKTGWRLIYGFLVLLVAVGGVLATLLVKVL